MRTASGLAMMVAVLLLLGACGGAFKLYMDRQSMVDVIGDYGQTLTALPVASPQAAHAFASAVEEARSGRYAEARVRLAEGRTAAAQGGPAAMPGMPGAPGIPGLPGVGQPDGGAPVSDADVEKALRELPDDARPFFEQRRELFRRALMVSAAARQVAPEKWEAHRAKILAAAAAGDEAKVEALLREARQDFGMGGPGAGGSGRMGPGGMPRGGGGERGGMPGLPDVTGASPDQLAGMIAQSRQMLAGAKAAGLDTREVEGLLNRADAELRAGNAQKAAASLRQAFDVVRQAMAGGGGRPSGPPRMARGGPGGPPGGGGGRRPGGMPGMAMPPGMAGGPGMGMPQGPGMAGGPGGVFPDVFGLLVGNMQRESGVLAGVLEDLENAGLALREKNQEQMREILSAASQKIAAIGKRRNELEGRLRPGQIAPPGEEPRAAWQGPGGRGPGGRRPGGESPGGPGPGPAVQWPGGFPIPGLGSGAGFDLKRISEVLAKALDEARGMPQDEYEKQRDTFVQGLLGRLMAAVMGQPDLMVPPPEGGRPDVLTGLPPLEVPAAEPTEPEARTQLETQVRDRLRLLQEPYAALERVGADVAPVAAELVLAREAVNGGRLTEAANATNTANDMLWQLTETHRGELEGLKVEIAAGGS
ncbi:MAG: hypothetical protein FJX74_09935 [Armatimonadetes bacterium]|nr:hypothetical protein [Armatimonadota bacterium]